DAKITDRISLAEFDALDEVSLTSKHVIFISDASTISSDSNAIKHLRNLFINNGTTIVAVYPDSEDMKTLNDIAGDNLATPENEPDHKRFEAVAVSHRLIDNKIPYTFVYLKKCEENTSYTDINPNSVTHTDLNSADIDPEPESIDVEAYTQQKRQEQQNRAAETEAVKQAFLASRVESFLAWAEGLDDRAVEISDKVNASAARLEASVMLGAEDKSKELADVVKGLQTTIPLNFSEYFPDYDDRCWEQEHGNPDWPKDRSISMGNYRQFQEKADIDSHSVRDNYWNFNIARNTSALHTVLSLHSFENHADYYLVESSVTTYPVGLQIRSEHGDYKTGDEIDGSGAYHYAIVAGSTKALELYVWPDGPTHKFQMVKWLPDTTVNNTTDYSDKNGWEIGGGVAVKGEYGSETESDIDENEEATPAKNTSGWKVGMEASFNWSISHTSTTQWSKPDYDLIPKNYVDGGGIPIALWRLEVSDPTYNDSEHAWNPFPASGRQVVTLKSEAIWRIEQDAASDVFFQSRVDWENYFGWRHDWDSARATGRYDCAVHHFGGNNPINIPRPSHTGVTGPLNPDGTNGTITSHTNNEGATFYARVFSEAEWTASSDSPWLQLTKTSGGDSNGDQLGYTVTANDTGADR
ncbi:MAG: BACON domain-containing protein, partial [Synergistaceae bacterium]|nr:BACON domain-containing protein [Synergistaceae bacterium]